MDSVCRVKYHCHTDYFHELALATQLFVHKTLHGISRKSDERFSFDVTSQTEGWTDGDDFRTVR
jgi:hypothetical protein